MKVKLKVNDHVRILFHDVNNINAFARVVAVEEDGVYVSNYNMPYCGTYGNQFIRLSLVEKVGK